MASRKRALLEPTDDWQQLQFQLDWLEQTRYELIRPVVVFGAPPVERAEQTGRLCPHHLSAGRVASTSSGMQSLFEAEPVEDKRALPRGHPSGDRPAQGRVPSRSGPTSWPRSARSASSDGPARTPSRRSWPRSRHRPRSCVGSRRYAEMTDPIERRGAIVRLACRRLEHRQHRRAIWRPAARPSTTTLKRWIEEGVRGLEDKAPIPPPAGDQDRRSGRWRRSASSSRTRSWAPSGSMRPSSSSGST